MRIDPATYDDVYRVALNMRDEDYEEFLCVSWADNREDLAHYVAERFGRRSDVMCASVSGKPVCIGGAMVIRPNVASLLLFATDDFPDVALPVARFIRKQLFPRLAEAGVHRFETVSAETHHKAHAWMRAIGLKRETEPMLGYGRDGQAFIQFSKVTTDVKNH